MKDARTGIAKGTFWKFYQEAQITFYTRTNIKSAWRTAGIVPYNPNIVLTQRLDYKASRPVPKVSTSRVSNLLRTPVNFRELQQQTLSALGIS